MKCFYHSADLDGHCSGAIVKYAFPECEMIGINYGQEFPWDTIEEDEVVFMVDFSLQPFEDMEKLNDTCVELHWFDHHKTAIDEAHKRGFFASGVQSLEVGKAACELVWGWLNETEIPPTVRLLGRYDVWDHSNPDTLPFQYGMRFIEDTSPDDQNLWVPLFKGSNKYFHEILSRGRVLLKYETTQNAKFCKAYAFKTELNGMKAICANRGFTNSKLFDSVYDPEEHHLMIAFCRLKLPAQKWTVSLYSTRDDVDCSAIAKSFGGGGHKGAAGFQCEILPFSI